MFSSTEGDLNVSYPPRHSHLARPSDPVNLFESSSANRNAMFSGLHSNGPPIYPTFDNPGGNGFSAERSPGYGGMNFQQKIPCSNPPWPLAKDNGVSMMSTDDWYTYARQRGFIVCEHLEQVLQRSSRSAMSSSNKLILNQFKTRYGEVDSKTRSSYIQLGVRVPTKEHVSEIVGKGGSKIKTLRDESGALITTPGEQDDHVFIIEAPPSVAFRTAERIRQRAEEITMNKATDRRRSFGPPYSSTSNAHLTTNGGPSSAGNCTGLMPINGTGNLMTSGTSNGTQHRRLLARDRIGVPQDMVGKIIGTGGSIVTTIQRDTGTEIRSPPKDSTRDSKDCAEFEISTYEHVGVTYDMARERIARAKQLIAHLVMRQYEKMDETFDMLPSGAGDAMLLTTSKETNDTNGGKHHHHHHSSGHSEWRWPDIQPMPTEEAREVIDRILMESKSKATRRASSPDLFSGGNGDVAHFHGSTTGMMPHSLSHQPFYSHHSSAMLPQAAAPAPHRSWTGETFRKQRDLFSFSAMTAALPDNNYGPSNMDMRLAGGTDKTDCMLSECGNYGAYPPLNRTFPSAASVCFPPTQQQSCYQRKATFQEVNPNNLPAFEEQYHNMKSPYLPAEMLLSSHNNKRQQPPRLDPVEDSQSLWSVLPETGLNGTATMSCWPPIPHKDQADLSALTNMTFNCNTESTNTCHFHLPLSPTEAFHNNNNFPGDMWLGNGSQFRDALASSNDSGFESLPGGSDMIATTCSLTQHSTQRFNNNNNNTLAAAAANFPLPFPQEVSSSSSGLLLQPQHAVKVPLQDAVISENIWQADGAILPTITNAMVGIIGDGRKKTPSPPFCSKP